jgi:hypothetical protein
MPEEEMPVEDAVLLSLLFDVQTLAENVEQVKMKVEALARQRGLELPPAVE